MNELIRLSYGFEVRAAEDSKRSVDVIASSAAIDGYGEIVAQDWDLTRYLANPVVLYGHSSWDMPIGHASNVRVENGKLLATLNFVDEKANPLAERVWQGIKQGSLRAVSVGFRTRNKPTSVDVNGKPVVMLTGNELMEISVVPIPANPEAVAFAAKALIDNLRSLMAAEPSETIDMNTKLLAAILSLSDAATEADVTKSVTALRDAHAALLDALGAKSNAEALGVIKAWQESHSKVAELSAQMAEMQMAATAAERKSLIDGARAAGKLAPSLLEWAEKCELDALKAYVASAPAIPQFAAKHVEETRRSSDLTWNGKKWDDLEPREKHALHNENYDLYVAMRDAA